MLWVLKVTVFHVSQHVLVGDVMKVIGVFYLLICMSVLLQSHTEGILNAVRLMTGFLS